MTNNDPHKFWLLVKIGAPDECWLWQGTVDTNGYGRYGHKTKAHRMALALAEQIPLPPSAVVIRHACDVRLCCNPKHLSSGTVAQNNQDMVDHGRSARGEKNPTARLDAATVYKIRDLKKFGLSAPTIARQVGISRRTVLNVLAGDTWQHLPSLSQDRSRSTWKSKDLTSES